MFIDRRPLERTLAAVGAAERQLPQPISFFEAYSINISLLTEQKPGLPMSREADCCHFVLATSAVEKSFISIGSRQSPLTSSQAL